MIITKWNGFQLLTPSKGKVIQMKIGRHDLNDYVTIIIPALNEAQTITDVINKAKVYSNSIIVIDGNSTDGTAEIARSAGAKIVKDHGRGKGEAIRTVIPYISGEIAVFIDADGSHDPNDIPALVLPIMEDQADHVSASRLTGGSSELHGGFDECFRLMGSSLITACINHRFGVRLSESQNGFRAIKTDVLKLLHLQENITTIEQEMIIKTLKKGYRMAEVPSHEHKRKAGYSKISIRKVAFRYVYSMIKYLYF
jgi:dolichol-phosphate hexosyltransferase